MNLGSFGRYVIGLVFFMPFIYSCDSSGADSAEEDFSDLVSIDSDHDGFNLVLASGMTVSLGTNEESAPAKSRPVMKVSFSYDFSLGRSEVSCGEYNEVVESVKIDGALLTKVDCKDEMYPVTNVTYFDAVLYANALSKKQNLDTAYTYSKVSFDSDGHCNGIEGLDFHPEVAAYRLPTEAEWVFASSIDWDLKKSWNAGNSDFRVHEVCALESDSLHFCDMAGNVMEWVNDWLGNFQSKTVVNYVGAPDGGGLGERVLKGGSYRNDLNAINTYSRGDVYTVTSSTRADYVGFRLAFGIIPNAVWLGHDGNEVANRVVVIANPETVRGITGTYRSKLVFRNDVTGNLTYINYSNGSMSAVEIKDTMSAYHPDISPDGKWVAFCTGMEGVSGKSSLYVRSLDEAGSHLVKLNVESAAIPRW